MLDASVLAQEFFYKKTDSFFAEPSAPGESSLGIVSGDAMH